MLVKLLYGGCGVDGLFFLVMCVVLVLLLIGVVL